MLTHVSGHTLRRIGRRAVHLLALGLFMPSVGCERRGELALPSPLVEGSEESRPLTAPTAFDLAPVPGGAMLAWAAPGAGLVLQRFDADGRPTGGDEARVRITSVGAGVADLALTAAANDVAVAWNEAPPPSEPGGTLRAAWVAANGDVRSYALGASFRDDGSRRGSLALATRERGALLLARGLVANCPDTRERACASFQFFEFGPDAARATGLGLTVPSPCASHSAQLVSAQRSAAGAAGPFEYAICAGPAGATALTVFSIQPNPAYAAAEEALAGCEPLGSGRFGGEATFVGVCGGQRRSVSVPAEGGALVVRNLDQRGLICNTGGAVLRYGDGWLRPSEPLGHLELLLNDDLAPPGARAAWAGKALLVAQTRAGQLLISRHGCRGAQLLELDATGDSADSG